MFDITFRDGSTAEFRNSLGIYVPSEFMSNEFEAYMFVSGLNRLEPGSSYTSKTYVAILDVDRENPIFIRIFVEDNFLGVKFSEDAPRVPYKNTRSPFIVE